MSETTATPQKRPCYYAEYLQLDSLLATQAPESVRLGRPAHDEMLFIIVHQAYELWFKQILHELDRIQLDFAASPVDDRAVARGVAGLRRIHRIFELLVHQLDVLETMTPLDFLDFRDLLIPASGFQSAQFRQIEIRLGLSADARLLFDERPYDSRLSEADRVTLRAAASGPKLVEQVDAWLARTPFVDWGSTRFRDAYRAAVVAMLTRDAAEVRGHSGLPAEAREAEAAAIEKALAAFNALFEADAPEHGWRMSGPAVEAAMMITAYRDEPVLQVPFSLLSALMDIDEVMTLWRYRHALMVERMIGVKVGTGGSSGHDYLKATAARHRVFGDLFRLSSYLIPRSDLPPLPRDVARRMGFVYADGAGA